MKSTPLVIYIPMLIKSNMYIKKKRQNAHIKTTCLLLLFHDVASSLLLAAPKSLSMCSLFHAMPCNVCVSPGREQTTETPL